MIRLRPFLLSALTVLVTVTSLGIAMARGTMAADGQLCSGTGPQMLVLAHDGLPLFDDGGDPVLLDRVACLDCLIGGLLLPSATGCATTPDTAPLALTTLLFSDWIAAQEPRAGQARAPPFAA